MGSVINGVIEAIADVLEGVIKEREAPPQTDPYPGPIITSLQDEHLWREVLNESVIEEIKRPPTLYNNHNIGMMSLPFKSALLTHMFWASAGSHTA